VKCDDGHDAERAQPVEGRDVADPPQQI